MASEAHQLSSHYLTSQALVQLGLAPGEVEMTARHTIVPEYTPPLSPISPSLLLAMKKQREPVGLSFVEDIASASYAPR